MSTENSTTKFKVLVGVLAFLLIALGIYTVSLYNSSRETTNSLTEDKVKIESELESLIKEYDVVIQENDIKDKDLLAARQRIEVLLDSVKDSEANMALIRRYRSEIGRLKNERLELFKRADSLIALNQVLLTERDSTATILSQTLRTVDSVAIENQTLAETVAKGAEVKVADLAAEAVIVRNSGRIVDTRRASRADKVRSCFTLTENAIASPGDRLLLVQVINPKNNVLGDKAVMNFEDDTSLTYSATTKVFYENEELDVCVMVNAAEEDLVSGLYTINVFDGSKQVASTTLTLK
ncbi:hypothetical protein [Gilvibacter sediminis]|uniref:hypothetical protein n=1 Tax=Gilvibacter sediminis TaxID=379071 RepID=UPI0023500129|nr:hypothetical protein [Gilvibacter sediminis]MDC7997106.1 hypothetical protein [Gilvibacter sediminis]